MTKGEEELDFLVIASIEVVDHADDFGTEVMPIMVADEGQAQEFIG